MPTSWKSWKYKNLTFFFISVFIAAGLSQWEPYHKALLSLGQYGYFSAFAAGLLFVSTFTVVPAAVMLLILAERLSLAELVIIAGLGGVFGDYLIFHYFRTNLKQELVDVYHGMGGHHISRLLHLKHFAWTLPVLGGLILASPFPDELGVSLMGISKMRTYQFLLVAFLFDMLGVLLVVAASTFIKP